MDDAELRSQLSCTHNSAFGWALSCCGGDQVAAEEALHDVYVMVLEGRAKFAGTSAFRTWLFGVIRTTALAQRRRSWLRSLLLSRNADQVTPQANAVRTMLPSATPVAHIFAPPLLNSRPGSAKSCTWSSTRISPSRRRPR